MRLGRWWMLPALAILLGGAIVFARDYQYRHPYSPLFFSVADLPTPASPAPTPTPVMMYRALDVGKRGVPQLNASDRTEIDLAVRRGVADRLGIWWAYTGDAKSSSGFVMIDAANPNLRPIRDHPAFEVITDTKLKCNNVAYDPIENREFAMLSCW